MNVLVTGGLGYVGSFVVRSLLAEKHTPFILDDFSTGNAWSAPDGVRVTRGYCGDAAKLIGVVGGAPVPDAVIHLAASAYVGESCKNPQKYHDNNVGQSLALLRWCLNKGVRRVVFASSCAIHDPVSPYARTKAYIESVIADYSDRYGMEGVILRLYNVAGASPDALLGEAHNPETHLIPRVIDAYLRHEVIEIYESKKIDYAKYRDYIHVQDVADAFVLALTCEPATYEIGTGEHTNPFKILETLKAITGRYPKFALKRDREGDGKSICADRCALDHQRRKNGLNFQWQAKCSLATIVESAFRWELKRRGLA